MKTRLVIPTHFWSAALLVVLLATTRTAGAQGTGDECGVDGSDFLNDEFTGEWAVSGPGCTIGTSKQCYCSPILGDADPLGEWVWQCNENETGELDVPLVPFGPATGKVCPDTIPVALGFDAEQNGGKNPACTVDNPTGQAGDPPCVYETCSTGGDLSAVCGCVDLTFGQGDTSEGDLQWFCLHSVCTCPPSAATAHNVDVSSVLVVVVGAVSLLF